MELNEAKQIISECVGKLPKADRKRLQLHAERNTPVLCGKDISLHAHVINPNRLRGHIDGMGAGRIQVLASCRKVPKRTTGKMIDRWVKRETTLIGTNKKFSQAVRRINPKSLRRLLLTVV